MIVSILFQVLSVRGLQKNIAGFATICDKYGSDFLSF